MKFFTILFLFFSLHAAEQGNVLIYTDPVQVTTEISPYEPLAQNQPITGTLMITHDSNLKIDDSSFMIGNKSLKTQFQQETKISPTNNLIISIYQFELEGLKIGNHNLPPITVIVGGETYQAPSLNIIIDH